MKRLCFLMMAILGLASEAVGQGDRLVLPFNSSVQGFDTGISLSNSSDLAGAFTFFLFADTTTGGKATIAVDSGDLADIGEGLDEDGNLAAGGTYSVLLSELCQVAGLAGYTGQIRLDTAFTDANAVNLLFNESFGSAHGWSATKLPVVEAVGGDEQSDVEALLQGFKTTLTVMKGNREGLDKEKICSAIRDIDIALKELKGVPDTPGAEGRVEAALDWAISAICSLDPKKGSALDQLKESMKKLRKCLF